MADSNPKLTSELHGTRDTLLVERSDIMRRVQELHKELEANSSKIEATDTVIRLFNPDHVSFDLRTGADAARVTDAAERTLQLSSSVATVASETAPESKSKVSPPNLVSEIQTARRTKKTAATKKMTVAQQIEAIDEALGAKAERSPERQAISSYFQQTGRNDTILKILESKDEPVNASTVAKDYKALFPLPEDSATMRNLFSSRVSSALYYLKARGQAIRIADERGEGKTGENVRWELAKSCRRDLRKSRGVGRSKIGDQPYGATELTAEDVKVA